LKELTTLRVIDLGNNKISDLAEFSELKGLKSLSLDGNEIAQLPRNAVFADLIEIDLSRNQIIDFSPETFSFPELRSLSVNDNQLERVINLEHIKNLEIVNMSGNKLLKVDSQFGPKVRALDFSFNQIFDSAFLQQFIGRTELTFINLIGNLDNQGSPLRCPAEIQDKCLTL
jgi:Leucine-rich repeat (LRR) protein